MAHTQQTAVLWQWRFYDASRRRWITLWWHMTPEEAEAWGDARGVKLERLDPPGGIREEAMHRRSLADFEEGSERSS
jgi:hypothetical protein